MVELKQTFCILCYVNCGLEVANNPGFRRRDLPLDTLAASPHRTPVVATSTR